MNLGLRLKEERERLGYTQPAFAALAGSKKHAQINWEKGQASPNAAALAEWAKVGLDVLYVVTGIRSVESVSVLSRREAALLDNYRHSPEDARVAIDKTSAALSQPKVAGSTG